MVTNSLKDSGKTKWELLCICLAMVLPLVGSVFYFVILNQGPTAQVIYTTTKVFTLLWPILVVLSLEKPKLKLGHINWTSHLRAIPLGIITGLLIVALMMVLYKFTLLGDIVRNNSDAIRAKAVDMGFLEHYWTFAIFLSLAHSLLEEYYWRWYIFGRIKRFVKPIFAYGLASLAFAGHHYVVLGVFFGLPMAILLGTLVGIGGLLWCWMFARSKSLLGIWISHGLVDAGIMYIGYEFMK